MHAIMKFRMRRRDRYECDVLHPLSLDGMYDMFCSRENKQSRVYKIGVHFDLQNSSMFPLEVNWNTATDWENSCSFGLQYVSWYKCLIVSLVFSHLGFWSGNLFLIAPFPDLCLLVSF